MPMMMLQCKTLEELRHSNKTVFVTRSSEKLEGKAAGGKGSEVRHGGSRTFIADNADLKLCSWPQ